MLRGRFSLTYLLNLVCGWLKFMDQNRSVLNLKPDQNDTSNLESDQNT